MKKPSKLFPVLMMLLLSFVSCENNSKVSFGALPSAEEQSAVSEDTFAEDSLETIKRPAPVIVKEPDTVEGFSYYLDERIPSDVRKIVLENRQRLFVNINHDIDENPGKYLTLDYDEAVDDSIVETLKNADSIKRERTMLPFETVEKELDFLMIYLKYAYGAYQYYGGDEVFLPMRDMILNELKEKDSEGASYKDYSYALYRNLSSVIVDCHFSIGNRRFSDEQSHRYFIKNSEYEFDLKNNVYYTDINGLYYELISIDDLAPENMMVPYLNDSGHMVWIIGYPSTTELKKSHDIVLYSEKENKLMKEKITLTSSSPMTRETDTMYNEYDLAGIRVVESRRCYPKANESDMYEVMTEAAVNLRDKNIIIVDLRNNVGGSDGYGIRWLSSLLNQPFEGPRGVFCSHRTKTTYATFGYAHAMTPDYESFSPAESYESWSGPFIGTSKVYENKDRVFIVLANQYTVSAGEGFVDYLRQTENTIIVGTNTTGAYSTGNVAQIKLPYSKVKISCGFNLHLEPDLSSIEGIGIKPDIWAPPDASLERVVKFIENYGLAD